MQQKIQEANTDGNRQKTKIRREGTQRENPEKLTKAYQKYDKQNETQKHENNQEHEWKEWETYQQRLGKILEETYPLKKKKTQKQQNQNGPH